VLLAPALADIGTGGFLADGVEFQIVYDFTRIQPGLASFCVLFFSGCTSAIGLET
jgi:hypothetical protein